MYVLQFGMLIEFLFEKLPKLEKVNGQAVGDLEVSLKPFGLAWFSYALDITHNYYFLLSRLRIYRLIKISVFLSEYSYENLCN